jgi:hypothetical protein
LLRPILKYAGIFLEGLRKTTKSLSRNNQCLYRDSKAESPKYKSEMLSLDPICSLLMVKMPLIKEILYSLHFSFRTLMALQWRLCLSVALSKLLYQLTGLHDISYEVISLGDTALYSVNSGGLDFVHLPVI